MSVSVSMPQLGESVTEGTVTRWLKKEGERVEVDEPLLEVSTDKVDTEIPSPASGILRGIAVDEDETVAVGAQLAVIEDSESGDAAFPADDSASAEASQPEAAEPEAAEPEAAEPEAAEPESGSRRPARTAGVRSPTTLPRPRTPRRPRTATPSPLPPTPHRLPATASRRHRLPTASPRPPSARCPRRASPPRPSRPRRLRRLPPVHRFPRAGRLPPTLKLTSTRRPRHCRPAPTRPTSPRWSASSPPSTR